MPDDNIQDSLETVQRIVDFARDCAFDRERMNPSPCLSRPETKIFMARYRLGIDDIREMLSRLRVEDYSYTSRETGEADAYVFGPDTRENYDVFLKIQVVRGIIVISFHEPDRKMNYPYRRSAK